MIDHVSVGVRDLDAASRFYEGVLATLGYSVLERRPATIGFGKQYAEFWINARPNLTPACESGAHICLRAKNTASVEAFHAAAIAAGGTDAGAPGSRPHHGDGYFAAFVRDPDGNCIEAVTFVQQD